MRKIKVILFSLLVYLLLINNVFADCTKEEIANFKEIEDEYKITYEFNKDTKDYNIIFNSPYQDKYSYRIECQNNDFDNIEYEELDENRYMVKKIKPGKCNIYIDGITSTCDDVMKQEVLTLPEYNKYSEDPLCEGIEEFVLCQPTYNKKIDYDTFKSRINTYKKTISNKNNNTSNDTTKENIYIEYIKNNWIQIIIVTAFIKLLIITIIMIVKSIKKSRRLE